MTQTSDARAAGLRPYASYKPSGVGWLASIPETWSMQRNGRLFAQRNETGRPDLPVLEVSLRTGVRVRDFAAGDRKQAMDDRARYKVAHAGDLAYNMMRMWQGAVGVVPVDGLVSPAYVVARPFDLPAARYFDLLFRTPSYMREVENWSRGIVPDRNRLYWESFKQIQTPVPPREEQQAIVRFLDHMDHRIRRYIAAKKKVITLLNEQKQAIIHRAITRSLGADVLDRFTDDCRPAVEGNARVARLGRYIAAIDQGWSPVAAEGHWKPEQWGVLTLSAVRRGRFDRDAVKPIPLHQSVPSSLQVRNGDLLLTRSNTRERVGDVAIATDVRAQTILCDLMYRLRLRPELSAEFLLLQLLSRAGRTQIERDARGSSGTMPKINHTHVRNWKIVVTSLEEQYATVQTVRNETSFLTRAQDAAEREIALMMEYRARLVSEVVTGGVDVRDSAERLTDGIEDWFDGAESRDEPADVDNDAAEEEGALA